MADKKVQGEGNYDAARRFRKEESNFVKEETKGGKTIRGDASKASDTLTPAEREGRSHAKGPGQDKRDAKKMGKMEEKSAR